MPDRMLTEGAAYAHYFAECPCCGKQLKQWHENGEPLPPPNAGGILRRYFNSDWDALYTWAAPYLTPLEGAKPPTLPKPNLRLITGGDSA